VYTPTETLLTAQRVMPANATYLEFMFPHKFKLPYVMAVSQRCQHPIPKQVFHLLTIFLDIRQEYLFKN
jgi:hypothetical protein